MVPRAHPPLVPAGDPPLCEATEEGGSAGNGDEGREANAGFIAGLKIPPQVLGYWHTPPETGRERVSKVQSLFWSET